MRESPREHSMKSRHKNDINARLRRITGQIGGIQRMVAEDRYPIDVLTQVSAARAALAKIATLLLASHLETSVTEAFAAGGKRRLEKVDELLRLFESGR